MVRDSKTVRLHIDDEQLDFDSFKKSVNSFADMVKALSDDAAPFAQWLFSVDHGSMVFNADPCFEVISGFIGRLSSGRDVGLCPKKARDEYRKLVSVVGAKDNGPTRASIEVINGNYPVKHAPVRQAFEVVGEPRSYQVVGSVVGTICTLDAKRGNKFGMVDEGTGKYIKGKFQDKILEEIRSSFKCRARVSGVLTYRSDGVVTSVDARKVVMLPDKLPRLSSLCGFLEA